MQAQPTRAPVFAKFLRDSILSDKGRHFYSLLYAFAASGHPVLLFDNKSEGELGTYGLMARKLDGVLPTREVPEVSTDKIYLFDDEDPSVGRQRWLKKVKVGFDIFSPYWLRDPIVMPFSLHPVHTGRDLPQRLSRLRDSRRSVRVFFSGEVEGYTQNRIRYPTAKLPRATVIDTIVQQMGDDAVDVRDQAVLDGLPAGPYLHKCVVADTRCVRVREQEWLDFLAGADFFLAPPGIVMPMCHNAVEAMAVGAIPIINYPEWFGPRLEHLRNCIAFDDERDLVDKVKLALGMDPAQVLAMRRQVIEYYETHLRSDAFVADLMAKPGRKHELLMISGRYVAANAARLGKSSVLLRDRAGGGVMARLPRMGG